MPGFYITCLHEYSVFLAALDDFQLKHFLYLLTMEVKIV